MMWDYFNHGMVQSRRGNHKHCTSIRRLFSHQKRTDSWPNLMKVAEINDV